MYCMVTESSGSVRSFSNAARSAGACAASSGTRPAIVSSRSSIALAERSSSSASTGSVPSASARSACTSATARPSRSASPAKSPPTSPACSSGAAIRSRTLVVAIAQPSTASETNCWSMPTVVGSPSRSPVIEPSGARDVLAADTLQRAVQQQVLVLARGQLPEQLEDVLPAVDQGGVALLRRDRPRAQTGLQLDARLVLEDERADAALPRHQVQQHAGDVEVAGRLVGVEVADRADPAAGRDLRRVRPPAHEQLVRLAPVVLDDLDDHVQQLRIACDQLGHAERPDAGHRPVLAGEPALLRQPALQVLGQVVDQLTRVGQGTHLASPSSPELVSWNQ